MALVLAAIRAYEAAKGKAKRELLRDVLVISLLTIQVSGGGSAGPVWH